MDTKNQQPKTTSEAEQLVKATGLSREAVDTLMLLNAQNSPALPLLSALFASPITVFTVLSAATSTYKDDYTKYGEQFIPARRLYAAEKQDLQDAMLQFINQYRQDHDMAPLG